MPKYTFDTSTIISRKLSDFPDNFLLSEIVLLELMGSASEESTLKMYQALRKTYQEDDLLMTPNTDDWLKASKILFRLEQGT